MATIFEPKDSCFVKLCNAKMFRTFGDYVYAYYGPGDHYPFYGNYILDVGSQMCECGKAEAKASAGAPEHEIEVTPEMIEAGVSVVRSYGYEWAALDCAVREVFEEMENARRASSYK